MECVNCECTNKAMNNLDGAIRFLLERGKRVNHMMKTEKVYKEPKETKEQSKEEVVKKVKSEPKVKPEVKEVTSPTVTMDVTMSGCEKKRYIYNKYLKRAESIDFDIPSLAVEDSSCSISSSDPTSRCPIVRSKNASKTTFTTSNGISTTMTYDESESSRDSPKKEKVISKKNEKKTSKNHSSTNVTSKGNGPPKKLTSHSDFMKELAKAPSGLVLNESYLSERNGVSATLPLKVHVTKRKNDDSLHVVLRYLDEDGDEIMEISCTLGADDETRNVKQNGVPMKKI